MTLATVVTWNLVFKGVVGGLITALVAMGIVLVYRSSRVINFAVGNMGARIAAVVCVACQERKQFSTRSASAEIVSRPSSSRVAVANASSTQRACPAETFSSG